MKRILVRGALGVVVLLLLAVGAAYVVVSGRMSAVYDVPVAAIETSTDSSVLARGYHVARIRGCLDCHGDDLGGRHFFDGMPVASVTATNLTSGENGMAPYYTDEDWVRAIRSGVGHDGTPLLVMPSYEYRALGPEDLGALVSWIRSMPPVDTEPVDQKIGPVGVVLLLTGQAPLIPAEAIDHDDDTFSQPEVAATAEYGAYLATSCIGCHGENFAGGPTPGMPPDWPEAANLTPDMGTGLGSWTKEDYLHFAETGVAPDGRMRDAMYMPWPLMQAMTDVERDALWMFLRSLPATAKPE